MTRAQKERQAASSPAEELLLVIEAAMGADYGDDEDRAQAHYVTDQVMAYLRSYFDASTGPQVPAGTGRHISARERAALEGGILAALAEAELDAETLHRTSRILYEQAFEVLQLRVTE